MWQKLLMPCPAPLWSLWLAMCCHASALVCPWPIFCVLQSQWLASSNPKTHTPPPITKQCSFASKWDKCWDIMFHTSLWDWARLRPPELAPVPCFFLFPHPLLSSLASASFINHMPLNPGLTVGLWGSQLGKYSKLTLIWFKNVEKQSAALKRMLWSHSFISLLYLLCQLCTPGVWKLDV